MKKIILFKTRLLNLDSDALENELSHFIDCVRYNNKPLVSANDGILALELGLKIEELIKEKDRSLI